MHMQCANWICFEQRTADSRCSAYTDTSAVLQVPKVTVIIGGSFGAGNYGELAPCCPVDRRHGISYNTDNSFGRR
jgi:hypothetical protein